MATVPTQIRIDEDLKKTGGRIICTAWLRYVECDEYIFKTVCFARRSSF